jgi:site-specific recombinase XerD
VAPADLLALLDSWTLHLRAERKSPATITAYGSGVRAFLTWCTVQGVSPELDRPTVNAWVADLLDGGAEATTARSRQHAVRSFSRWLAEEGEIDRDELLGLRPPKLDQKIVPRLTDEECAALVKACSGRDLRDRRDEALIRFMLETGVRAGEACALAVADVDLAHGVVTIRRGKGGKGRVVPIGPQTTRALDRYLRARRGHRLADGPDLWLGENGRGFSYPGLYKMLRERAAEAGIPDLHPHVLRHTAASRWLAAGGSEGGLMATCGWSDRAMLDRYTRSTASERAAAEARGLGLGDFG